MSKKKQCIFLSLVISTIFCFQVVASSDTYRDEKGILHSVITAKNGSEYGNTSTLISSHEEYTDKNGNVIKVVDYVNPDYAENVNVKKIIKEKLNYENDEAILYNFYDNYNAYKNARNRNSTNKTETKDTPKVRISISDYVPIHSIDDIENIAGYVIKAKVLEGKENTSFEEYSGDSKKRSNEITLHDAYGVYNAYKNPKNRSNTHRTREIPKIQILHSEFNTQIKNINDVEDMAQCIVKAKVLESENMPEGGMYTKTDIEITDVYKGNLNVGDIVTIVEDYCTTEIGVEMRVDGYSASTPGEEYLFYLGTHFDDGTYGIAGTVFGRYCLNDNEEADTIEANIIEECVPLYNQLKEEVMNKYNKN